MSNRADRPRLLVHALADRFRDEPEAEFCHWIGAGEAARMRVGDLEADCRLFAGAYAAAGLAPGTTVLLFLGHSRALYGAFFGAMLAGLVPSIMPVLTPRQDPALHWGSHRTLLSRLAPCAVVAASATLAEMRANGLLGRDVTSIALETVSGCTPFSGAWPEPSADRPALLQHSSGTTGLKKGVALGGAAIAAQLARYADALALTDADRIVSWLPLYHDMGLVACLLLPAFAGIPFTHLDAHRWAADPLSLLAAAQADRATLAWLPNFAFAHIAAAAGRPRRPRLDLSSLRQIVSCSEPIRADSLDRFTAALADDGLDPRAIGGCYAMAETVFAVTQTMPGEPPRHLAVDPVSLERGGAVLPGEQPLVSSGRPIADVRLTVVDADRRPLGERRVGEIAVAAPFLFSGYNLDPARTAERLADGTYFTGDLGFVADGELYVLGRFDDLVIVQGRNLYAHEIEGALAEVPGIRPGRAIAFGVPDARAGTDALVVVAERDDGAVVPDAALVAEISRRLQAIFAVVPARVALKAPGWLVKTTSGKISRRENRARWMNEEGR